MFYDAGLATYGRQDTRLDHDPSPPGERRDACRHGYSDLPRLFPLGAGNLLATAFRHQSC